MATAKQRAARRPYSKTTKKAKTKPAQTKEDNSVAVTASRPKPQKAASSRADAAPSVQTAAEPKTGRRRLPSVWQISRTSLNVVWSHWRVFLGIGIVYGVLNFVLVRGFSGFADASTVVSDALGTVPGSSASLSPGMSFLALLVTTNGSTLSNVSGTYEAILLLVTSLAIVWILRQAMAGAKKLRIRDGFYSGMYPLIPVLLVFMVILLQCLPFLIGGYVYSKVITNDIAINSLEKAGGSLLLLVGTIITIYFLSSSVFALYIATLPDMTPMKALKSARDLVRKRRWPILRKLVFLPIAMLAIYAAIMLPIIWLLTPIAAWLFFFVSTVGLIVWHAYMYTLYRELLA